MNFIKIIKYMLPPFIVDIIKIFVSTCYGWHGNYENWEKAMKHATGYDAPHILEKVKEALLKVKIGEAAYERDSVLFDEIEYSWPLLAGLLLASSCNNGQLSVLDFGGSLGSSYFQNRKFLDMLPFVSWNIVEQKHFVNEGKRSFESESLHFYYDVNECVKKEKPTVLLLSSVLQYLEKPYEMLDYLLSFEFTFVIIDRTPFHLHSKDRITIQKVPPWIYNASYPCWIFSLENFVKYFEKYNYLLIEEFDAIDGSVNKIFFKGFIFKKK